MTRDAIYQRSAAFAQRRADRAVNADDREEWLRVAQGWLALLRKRPMTALEMVRDGPPTVPEERVVITNENGDLVDVVYLREFVPEER